METFHYQCMNACIAQQPSRNPSSIHHASRLLSRFQLFQSALHAFISIAGSTFGGHRIERTDGSGLNHVADSESLDRLILGDAAGAVGAAHGLDVAAAVLVTTAVGRNNQVSFPGSKILCSSKPKRPPAIMNTVGNRRYVTRRPSFPFFFFFFLSGGGP